MGKAKLDYDWCWDTLFFGRGYMETYKFDKKKKILSPEVINPLVFGYDPYFTDPQQWRYYWKWVIKDKYTLQRLIKSGKITGVTRVEDIPSGVEPRLWEYKQRRDAAVKAVEPSLEPAGADVYQLLEYFGYNNKGERCVFWIDKHFNKILMEEKLEFDDLVLEDDTISSKWPIVVKESFRIPHASVPFSIADLLEDKHGAKSVLLNLAYISAKDTANPIYWYDTNKVEDVAQFFSRQINQHIPIDGDGSTAVGPLNTKDPMPPGLINFMTALQQEANDPVGTGVSMEPSSGGQETATEVAVDQQLNDMAQSLQSKILQFGEADFWSSWWHRYAKHAKELESKMANVVGVRGIESTEVSFDNFNTKFPPGVLVYSAKEAEYKNLVKRRDYMSMYPNLMETLGPEGMRNFNKYVFFPLFIEDPSLIDTMLPKSIEEAKAEAQNEMLAQDKMPPVLDTDDHQAHIYIHNMVQPKTWATWYHIAEHEAALARQQEQERQMQMEMGVAKAGGMEGAKKGGVLQSKETGQRPPAPVNKNKESTMGASAPLKEDAKTPTNINK